MKRVLITGAAGFVGANLVHRLVADGHAVTALVRPGSDTWRLNSVQKDLILQPVELSDAGSVLDAVRSSNAEWIFHLAAHGAYSWQNDREKIVATNLLGTQNILESCAAKGFESFVNVGSSSEYGLVDHPPREDELPKPNSYYAFAKAAATMYCTFLAQQESLAVRTLRLYSAYGPWEDPKRLIPTLIGNARAGRLPPLVDPDIARDYVFVGDVIDALIKAAERPVANHGEVLNIGTGEQTTIKQIVDCVIATYALSVEPKWGSMANRTWDTTCWVADNRRALDSIGWSPNTTLKKGLELTENWIQSNQTARYTYDNVAQTCT